MAKTVKKQDTQETKDTLQEKISALEKKFGVGVVIQGKDIKEELEVVPSGSLLLDLANNLGGTPVGKLIEVLGMESSGKSTLCLHAIAGFQKLEGRCVLVDFEQSFDRTYAEKLKIDVDKLLIIQPSCLEDGYNIAEELIRTGDIRLVIFDSHTAGMPKKVVDGEVGEVTIGLQARVNSQGLGKVKPLLKQNRCTLIAISQIRQNVGGYGDPNQSTGGLAYKFYSDIRYKVSKQVDKGKETNMTTIEVIKNKCAAPFGKAEGIHIIWGEGICRLQEIIDLAVEYKLLTKSGGWYKQGEQSLANGDEQMRKFLNDNPELCADIECKLMEKLKQE